ncbi:MAG: V-type ATP synthase subunit I [Eubacterium sp.]
MIVPMKKARLIALKEKKEELLLSLQRCGEFMVIPPKNEEEKSVNNELADIKVQQADSMLRFMKQFQKKKSFFEDRPTVDFETFVNENKKGCELIEKTEVLSEKLMTANAEIGTLKTECDQLEPWLNLDIPVESIKPTNDTNFHIGYIPPVFHEAILECIHENGGEVNLFGNAMEGQAALVITYKADDEVISKAIKEAGFIEASLPRVIGLPFDVCEQNNRKIVEINHLIEGYNEEMHHLAEDHDHLEILNEQYKAERDRNAVRFSETVETLFIEGWVRSDRIEIVEKAISDVTTIYDLSYEDPDPDEQPPTVTQNKKFWTPFESITEMYSPPKPGTIDPTPVSAPWFWLIFGMMMGDFGYGVLMAVGFGLFKKFKKPKGAFLMLINLLLYSSITTMIFGVLFGSYFGETWHPLIFSPMDDPMAMLIFSLIIGVLHIFSGMTLKIVEDVRSGHILDAIFDQVSWMLLILGAAMLFLPQTNKIGMIMALIGAVIVLFTAGRDKPSIIGKVTGGIVGLYGATSYLSDILSYSRILALSLATGVIAMVMNLLAGMIQGSVIGFILSLAIYLVGHTFNIAMSLLSAYVHDSRLQYIEFFNKFYDGGGYEFTPLAIRTKTIDVVDEFNQN